MTDVCNAVGLTYGTMKAENLHSLGGAECMMVRWMCGVSLKDGRHTVDFYSLLGVQVANKVRHGRLMTCVKDDMKFLGLQPECALLRDMWRDFIHGANDQCYYRELERNKNENDYNIVLPNEN